VEAFAIANQAVAGIRKHRRIIKQSFCRAEAERVVRYARGTIDAFTRFERRKLDEGSVRYSLDIVVAMIIELLVKLEDASRGAKPLVDELEGLVRTAIGWPWESNCAYVL
jgi:hypothetical protein